MQTLFVMFFYICLFMIFVRILVELFGGAGALIAFVILYIWGFNFITGMYGSSADYSQTKSDKNKKKK